MNHIHSKLFANLIDINFYSRNNLLWIIYDVLIIVKFDNLYQVLISKAFKRRKYLFTALKR